MPTLHQLANTGRKRKRRRSLVAALYGSPQRKGTIVKILYTTPRKPNSAKRRFAKVRMINLKKNRKPKIIHAKVPGIGSPHIQEFSEVMVEGGSPPDTPGVNYSLIRGKYDFVIREEFGRNKRRSKYGCRLPNFYDRMRARDNKIGTRRNLTETRKKLWNDRKWKRKKHQLIFKEKKNNVIIDIEDKIIFNKNDLIKEILIIKKKINEYN